MLSMSYIEEKMAIMVWLKLNKKAIIALIDSYRELFSDHHLPFFLMGIADEYYPYGDQYGYQYIFNTNTGQVQKNAIIVHS